MNIHSLSAILSARVPEETEQPQAALPAEIGDSVTSDTTSILFEYQKLASKEAREDKKLARQDRALAAASKAVKLQQDNEAIDRAMDEAGRKFEKSMDAAHSELVLGADKIEIAIAKLQQASSGATTTESDTSAAEQARERRNAAPENIQKLLDLIRGMNPRI